VSSSLEPVQSTATQTGAVAHIDTSALTHNLARARALAPESRVLAVIKADGYGHGLLPCARALGSADGFAVARMGEAQRLRSAGFSQRVLVLPGVFSVTELECAAAARLDVVVHSHEQLQLVEQAGDGLQLGVWLKVDSGMHRLGFSPADVKEVFRRLEQARAVRGTVKLMTHLADADQRELAGTRDQLRCFGECTAGLAAERSMANSAGLLAWPGTRSDWVRPGIMLYGVSPFADRTGSELGLRPAMTLHAMLISVKEVQAGSAIGYGATWLAPHSMSVGAASIGYADGFPRNAPNGTLLGVGRQQVPLVGRVSMDTVTLDLRAAPGARPGMRVTAWGESNPVENLARQCRTIPYELLCRVGSRVPRILD